MMTKPDLSIIIVSWNTRNLLKSFLESIFTYTASCSFEVIAIDNASSDDTVAMVRSTFPQVTVIANDHNSGFAHANNQGINQSRGEYIACVNPDMELREDAFSACVRHLKNNPAYGFVAPQLRYPDGSLQKTIKRNPSLCDQLMIALKLHHFIQTKCLKRYLGSDIDYAVEQDAQQIMGAAVIGSRDAWERVGNWDEDYFVWWEDLQMCLNAQKKGIAIRYLPNVHIVHHEGQSFSQRKSIIKQRIFARGMRTYFKKNHSFFAYAIIAPVSYISIALAAVAQLFHIKSRPQSKIPL